MSVRATTKRGKPVWLVQVIRDGGDFNRRRFLDRRTHRRQDALDVEAELIAEYEAAQRLASPLSSAGVTRPASAASKAATPTFADVAARYLAMQDPARSDYANKARYLRLHLLPHLGELPIDAITPMVLDDLKVKLRAPTGETASSRRSLTRTSPPASSRRKGAAKSPKTINNILTTLRSVLHLAHDYELIHRVPRIRMEKVPRPDPVFLDDDEIAQLLAAVPPEWWLLTFTAIRTGLRRGELMALRWADVHLEAPQPYLRVQRSVRKEGDGSLRVKEPKGGRSRTVPLASDISAALAERRPARPHTPALVFPGPVQGLLDHQELWRVLAAAGMAAGLEKHVHPHLLRHTFASHCYRAGVPPQVVQAWLGHAQISTTERYAHLAPRAGSTLIELLAQSTSSLPVILAERPI
ncbi:MAG: site-specific integrase [Myxococcales bacterium]|nr:site-specific integrase [Myxococcales bacterium]